MVTVSNIATQILNENNYTTGDITAINLEYLIDNAIDYVNMETSTSIADLSGAVAGSKSITGTEPEIVTVKFVTILMIRAYKDRGPNTVLSGMSITSLISDPQYAFYVDKIDRALNRLRGRSIKRT